MKRNTFLSVSCLLAATFTAQALESRLDHVRLYPSSGEAIRVIVIDEPVAGETVEIEGLPGSTRQQGLRAEVIEGNGVRLGGMRFSHLAPHELPDFPVLEEKEADLEALENKLADLKEAIRFEESRADLFSELQKALLKGIEENPGPAAAERIWEAFEGEQKARAAKLEKERSLAEEIDSLEDKKAQLKSEIQELGRIHQALNGRLELDFLEVGNGAVVIRVTAPMSGVGWSPAYRINALPAEEAWDFSYQANLRNETGEAWDSVPVTLLTGRPGWQLRAPDVPPVYLNKRETVGRKEARAIMDSQAEMALMAAAPAASFQPETERLTTQFSLKLPQPVSLKGFESGRTVDLTRESLDAVFWSETAPSISEKAFLHSETLLDLDWPILPGPATLLVDGAVSGNTRLPPAQPGEELELGFGENPAILVDFKVMSIEDRDSGVFDKVRRYARNYEMEVTNLMPVAHRVQVKSRFPISRDAEIEVNRLAPESVEVDEETGRFQWESTLAPEELHTFKTRFEVVAPRDWALPGGF